MRKREQIMLERIVFLGRINHPRSLWFYDKGLGLPLNDDNARYVIIETMFGERGASYRKDDIDTEKLADLPKRFVAILKMIAFPETL